MQLTQRVWQSAKVTITYADGSSAYFDKVRFLAIPGEPIRVMGNDGNVLAEFTPGRENEVSDKLVAYLPADGETGESWSVLNAEGRCGSCGGG